MATLQARPYHDPADLAAMRQLLMDGSQANLCASYAHPGYLDLVTHFPPDELAMRRNLRLWQSVDGDPVALAGWAIYWDWYDSFDLFVHPGLYGTRQHERMMDEYVAWAEERARAAGLNHLAPFCAMEYDRVLDRLMKVHGFVVTRADPPAPLFERTLDELPELGLPEGFSVQGVEDVADGRLRAWVGHAAFAIQTDWESYWGEYAQLIASEVYDGRRDLFVRAPDGRGASACTIWFDPINAVGLFEPVATHPDFQGRGLGKAVMAEGLRRMRAAGMRRAVVGFDPANVAARALYTSMGFQATAYFAAARKEL